MKTLFLIIPIIVLISCSNDDGPQEDIQEEPEQLEISSDNLVGSWMTVQVGSDDGTATFTYRNLEENERSLIIFMENLVVTNSRIDCDGTYELDEEARSITYDYDCIEPVNPTSVISSLTEQELILSRGDPAGEASILILERQ
ncbi:MAG: hypothetical protein WBG48_03415 [Pricia sp.]